ncbi:hypothetical protein ABMA28_004186 [Loxostege sticticalis]|uniref:Integrase catalytic domain-containing protein n=1 Tax=Loxostege sticticalis TaxID=481309 RepID=A0ABD0SUI8_LOXSC
MRIDNILKGDNQDYEDELMVYETMYNKIKRQLNRKLSSTTHLQQSTPKIDIPVFTGRYSQWPTFFDLFNETIHNNNSLSNAQKMQYLKGKLRGEAERLIQHLTISAENYETARDLLTHRYNNTQALFTNQIEIFLSQPSVHRQSSYELKRLYDTTMECIHAIHNLGVDTTSWDPLIVHLICKKLDAETYIDYKESRKSLRELPSFEELMNFIESKFTALEPLSKKEKDAQIQPKPSATSRPTFRPIYHKKMQQSKPYQAVATFTPKCPLCEEKHDLYQCTRFLNMSPETRLTTIAKHEICKNCLYKHYGKGCHSTKRCKYCNESHNSIIHDDISQSRSKAVSISSPSTSTSNDNRTVKPHGNKQHNVNHVAADDEEILLTTVSLRVKAADGTYITLRALLDQGSQISLLSENAAQILGLQRRHINASVSGIGISTKSGKGIVTMDCQSLYEDYNFTTQALIISKVINCLPNNTFSKQSWPHLQHINLADPDYNVSKPIDLLLDASIYSEIIMSGLIKGPIQAPIAQQTKLGWILSGNVKKFNCHVVINEVDEITKFWEVEGIHENSSNMSEQEQFCEDLYQTTTKRLDTGRYQVALPMKQGFEELLGTSKPKAIMQFKQLEKRMAKNNALSNAYCNFMQEYLDLGHMRTAEATDDMTSMPTCYLPHHGVLNMDSTSTKFRTVFNASSKTSSGHSLNDLMECGPNLQQDLQGLILLWRTHKYVITADIEKMFRQILIREQDTHLQTIVWRSSPQDHLREYQLTTVTYGTKAAPFLAIRTLRQIAQDHAEDYPLAAAALESSFYMDDLMSGHDSKEQVNELQRQLIEVLQGAGMNLRKWSSNDPDLINDLTASQISTPLEFRDTESRKTLGLRWNPSFDTFTFQNKIDYTTDNKKHTKRQLLSDISKIYDPLGWLSPITIKAKIVFQQTWLADLQWDDELPTDIQTEWQHLRDDLKNIEKFQIVRYLGNKQNYHLHGFCDASEKAYACAVYITTYDHKGDFTTRLVVAKTKLAPHKKQVSLPRLELLGALLLSQLIRKVTDSISVSSITAWTDSMVVLGWLSGDINKWKPFVANRVRQIISIIPASNWHHVRSEDNAADCATRGLSSKSLQDQKLWWEGPIWLNSPNPYQNLPTTEIEIPTIEVKKSAVVNTALHQSENIIINLLKDNSSLTRVIRIVSWVSRFITRLRRQNCTSQLNVVDTLTADELQSAQNLIIKNVQSRDFEDDIYHLKKQGHVRNSSKIASLNPYIDESGILRIGGRLEHATISRSAKHPVILSAKHRLTELIINQAHISTLHGGPRLTLSFIRNNYWIIGGIRVVKKIIRQCIKCRRFSQETNHQIMADLPRPRVNPSRPFTNTGVDFTGFVEVKANKGRGIKTTKGYIAVFVCLATKAVHLELVSDLSTPAFLAAFRRMCARRGTPRHVYSDNGTNFVGADKILKLEHKAILDTIDASFIKNISEIGVSWNFNCPVFPSAGGLWEAAVKSMKYHLKRVLGDQKLTYEEFITLLHQIEACMNSRPLCPLSENSDEEVLTPGHFLVGDSLISRPQTDPGNINLPTRWHLVQTMNKQFWKRWSTEYLQHLQTRSKWRNPSENMKVNDIVIIKEDNMPPGKWALGRIIQVHPGTDGFVRVVSLKTQNNIIKRPIIKLIKLPVHDVTKQHQTELDEENLPRQSQQPKEKTQRVGNSQKTFKTNFISLTLLTLIAILSPSMQQNAAPFNILDIDKGQNLYFDKISDLRHIKDEWKLVIYYNMTTYWHGLSDIKRYVTHIQSLCHVNTPYDSTVMQLQHTIDEIEHYNNLLRYQNKRLKRGLVNGIGYLANSLFGVLDERFADQYKNDIETIVHNENHLRNLIKNQTLIIESEYNIIKRNEEIMTNQVTFIKQTLKNLSIEVGQVRLDNQKDNYIIASSLAASTILSNLRRMQQVLLNTITDISHGQVDIHLFSPEQLEQQINFIAGQLHGDLALPTDITNMRQLYKLLKVFGRVCENYLIIEVRIPLVSNDVYELNKIITVPQRKGEQIRYVISSYQYIAFDVKKDAAFLLSEGSLRACIHGQKDTILCSLDEPIYDLKIKQSICDIKLINTDVTVNESPCSSHLAPCIADKWIKLHRRNSWLYSCCNECTVRIFCSTGTAVRSIMGTGVITMGQGCTIKGETFSIRSHNLYLSELHHQSEPIEMPKISILNTIINSSYTDPPISTEDHQLIYNQLRTDIDRIKEESSKQINVHDIHHYTIAYILLAGIILISCCAVYFWRMNRKQPPVPTTEEAIKEISHAVSTFSIDQGTSTTPVATQRFRVPSIN